MAETKRPRALINGFGRIGRLALRRSLGFGGVDLAAFDVVAVNDPLAVAESAAYLLEFDSTIGKFGSTTVAEDGESFSIKAAGGKESTFKFTRAKTPAEVGGHNFLFPRPPPPPSVPLNLSSSPARPRPFFHSILLPHRSPSKASTSSSSAPASSSPALPSSPFSTTAPRPSSSLRRSTTRRSPSSTAYTASTTKSTQTPTTPSSPRPPAPQTASRRSSR